MYERSQEARSKRLAENRAATSNNPMLNFLQFARRVLSQVDLEHAINQRPNTDYRLRLSRKGKFPSRPNQQEHQQQKRRKTNNSTASSYFGPKTILSISWEHPSPRSNLIASFSLKFLLIN